MEEASIAEDIVRKHVRAVGSVSYFLRCVLSFVPMILRSAINNLTARLGQHFEGLAPA